MKTVKLVFPLLLISALCPSFFSCSKDDNPFIPPVDTTYQFDSARYDWVTVYINGNPTDLIVLDTNIIYVTTLFDLRKLTGNQFSNIFTQDTMLISCAYGVTENEIYLGGANDNSFPMVMRLTNPVFNFEQIPNPNNLKFSISEIFAKNNSIFFATRGGRSLITMKNSQYMYYQVDSILSTDTISGYTTTYGAGLFFGEVEKVKCIYVHTSVNNIGTSGFGFYKILNYDGSSWGTEYYNTFSDENPPIALRRFGNALYGIQNHEIYKYNGNNFSLVLGNIKPRLDKSLSAGTNINSFVTSASDSGFYYLMNWNGTKWSKEYLHDVYSMRKAVTFKKNYYILYNYDGVYGELKIGRPKN